MPVQTSPYADSGPLWPLMLYFFAILVTVVIILSLSHFLGERHSERSTNLPYESGAASYGDARLRFSARFYLVALFFLIFDLEAAFIITWAIAFRQLGWGGYLEMLFFISVLLIGLFYLGKTGGLNWSFQKSIGG